MSNTITSKIIISNEANLRIPVQTNVPAVNLSKDIEQRIFGAVVHFAPQLKDHSQDVADHQIIDLTEKRKKIQEHANGKSLSNLNSVGISEKKLLILENSILDLFLNKSESIKTCCAGDLPFLSFKDLKEMPEHLLQRFFAVCKNAYTTSRFMLMCNHYNITAAEMLNKLSPLDDSQRSYLIIRYERIEMICSAFKLSLDDFVMQIKDISVPTLIHHLGYIKLLCAIGKTSQLSWLEIIKKADPFVLSEASKRQQFPLEK